MTSRLGPPRRWPITPPRWRTLPPWWAESRRIWRPWAGACAGRGGHWRAVCERWPDFWGAARDHDVLRLVRRLAVDKPLPRDDGFAALTCLTH